jgi:hypothetical protein
MLALPPPPPPPPSKTPVYSHPSLIDIMYETIIVI